jgi:hypothetical protein
MVIPHKHVNRYLNCEKTDQQIWDIVIETLRNSHTINGKGKRRNTRRENYLNQNKE